MPHNKSELSKYRMERAKEDIQAAQINIENGIIEQASDEIYEISAK